MRQSAVNFLSGAEPSEEEAVFTRESITKEDPPNTQQEKDFFTIELDMSPAAFAWPHTSHYKIALPQCN